MIYSIQWWNKITKQSIQKSEVQVGSLLIYSLGESGACSQTKKLFLAHTLYHINFLCTIYFCLKSSKTWPRTELFNYIFTNEIRQHKMYSVLLLKNIRRHSEMWTLIPQFKHKGKRGLFLVASQLPLNFRTSMDFSKADNNPI